MQKYRLIPEVSSEGTSLYTLTCDVLLNPAINSACKMLCFSKILADIIYQTSLRSAIWSQYSRLRISGVQILGMIEDGMTVL